MRYRIIVKEWHGLTMAAENNESYSAACTLACELSIRVPNVVFCVQHLTYPSQGWNDESEWRNGL